MGSHDPPDEDVVVRPFTAADAAAVAAWRYDGPWSVYDGSESERISAELGYHAIAERATGSFLGYVCLGADARVPGLQEEAGVLDVGVGLDPGIVGRGRGAAIMGPVLEWVAEQTDARELRAVVQAWNERSLRLCRRLGFDVAGHHGAPQGGGIVDYVLLRRPVRLADEERLGP